MKNMLVKVGLEKDFIEKNTPVLPISAWTCGNLLKKPDKMRWWKGVNVFVETTEFNVDIHSVRQSLQGAFPSSELPVEDHREIP